jgi:hypothetical protein
MTAQGTMGVLRPRLRLRGAAAVPALMTAASLLLAACASAVPVAVTASDTVEKSIEMGAASMVQVEMFNGPITIRPGPDGTVSATVTRTGVGPNEAAALADAELIEVSIAVDGRSVVLRARYGPDPASPDRRAAGAVVTVPARSIVVLRTSNDSITSAGLTGTIAANTSNGDISITDGTDALEARTSNGTIVVRNGAGLMSLETSNGAIDVEASGAAVEARGSNGPITFAGSLGRGITRLSTSNHDVTVTLPADASFGIDATTSGGSVTMEFPFVPTTPVTDTRLVGRVGSVPGTSLVIADSNGDIRIQQAK